MGENLRLLRFYFLILALFTLGRWGLSLGGAKYDATHQVFSLVTLALIASAHHAAFARAFAGYRFGQAVMLGVLIGLSTQIVIFASTAVSYLLGMQTFFNTPRALNQQHEVAMGAAMTIRAGGLVVNTILNTVAAAIGYAMGGALPAAPKK
jgi:hypothetical protein